MRLSSAQRSVPEGRRYRPPFYRGFGLSESSNQFSPSHITANDSQPRGRASAVFAIFSIAKQFD